MTNMIPESIEKLREWRRNSTWSDGNLHIVGDTLHETLKFDELIDEIEREIDERFMELPVDADGVPIHMGDTLQLGDTRGEVVALNYCPNNGKLPWEWQCDTGNWYNTAFARHVKPRTVEDVLEEFLHASADVCAEANCELEEQIAKYADELRELLGGDGE